MRTKWKQFAHLCQVAFKTWLFQICWIGTCAVSMLHATTVLISGHKLQDLTPTGFVFCATAFVYGYAAKGAAKRIAWAMALCSVFFFFGLEHAQQAVAALAALVWAAYHGLPGLGVGLRRYAVAKPVSIALVWAVATVLLPLPAGEWLPGGFLFIGRTAFVFALALAYDLCDLQHDRRHGLATLVQQLGPRRSFRVIDAALLLAAGCAFVNYTIGFFGTGTLAAIWISLAITAWAVRVAPERAEWGVWRKTTVDGLMILQAMLVTLSVK